MTGMPFVLAALAIALVLSWVGTLVFSKQPGLVAFTIDVIIVLAVPYLPPFRLPDTSCVYIARSALPCDPSWAVIGARGAAVPASHWIGGAVILAAPFAMCFFFDRRRAGRRPAFQGRG
jgi:hypothetical protein